MASLSVRGSFFGLNSSFTSHQQLLLFFDSTIKIVNARNLGVFSCRGQKGLRGRARATTRFGLQG